MPTYEVLNRNFQSPLNFEFNVARLKDFNYFVQKINLPDISIAPAMNGGASPFVKRPIPGDHMDFGELSVDFKINEGMENWHEIFSWMKGISFPESYKQHADLLDGTTPDLDGNPSGVAGVYSDGHIIVNTSQNNPFLKITFVDLHPVSLGEVVFDTRETDVIYLTATVSFKYTYFTVEKIGVI
jgi:hypothetical protein